MTEPSQDLETAASGSQSPASHPGDSSSWAVDPHLQAAEECVRRAREELRKAETFCAQMRHPSSPDNPRPGRSASDVIDGVLRMVRKYPGAGVIGAGLAGFLIGKLFRRLW